MGPYSHPLKAKSHLSKIGCGAVRPDMVRSRATPWKVWGIPVAYTTDGERAGMLQATLVCRPTRDPRPRSGLAFRSLLNSECKMKHAGDKECAGHVFTSALGGRVLTSLLVLMRSLLGRGKPSAMQEPLTTRDGHGTILGPRSYRYCLTSGSHQVAKLRTQRPPSSHQKSCAVSLTALALSSHRSGAEPLRAMLCT